jgi:hypothetical protein
MLYPVITGQPLHYTIIMNIYLYNFYVIYVTENGDVHPIADEALYCLHIDVLSLKQIISQLSMVVTADLGKEKSINKYSNRTVTVTSLLLS